MRPNWRIEVWSHEPRISDIVDVDTGRCVAQTIATDIAETILDVFRRCEELTKEVERLRLAIGCKNSL